MENFDMESFVKILALLLALVGGGIGGYIAYSLLKGGGGIGGICIAYSLLKKGSSSKGKRRYGYSQGSKTTVEEKTPEELLTQLLVKEGILKEGQELPHLYTLAKEIAVEKFRSIIEGEEDLREKRKKLIELFKEMPENMEERRRIKSLTLPAEVAEKISRSGFPLLVQELLLKMNLSPKVMQSRPEEGVKKALLYFFDKGVNFVKSNIRIYIESLEKEESEDRIEKYIKEIEKDLEKALR